MQRLSYTYLVDGGKRELASALAAIEAEPDAAATIKLLDEAYARPKAHVIGFTGPPGVGKSSLINVLVRAWREAGKTVGVIAVDPSSNLTGGALLGDRTRMVTDPEDQGVFVRSLASRGQLGGLAELAFPAIVLMRSLYDKLIVETVGVGQSEAEVSSLTDTVVLCVQPGSGDSLQFMKAGIMEIPHIAVVTKADMGPPAQRALSDLEGALSLANQYHHSEKNVWQVKVLALSASQGQGMDVLLNAIESHRDHLNRQDQLQQIRQAQGLHWLETHLRHKYGAVGIELLAQAGLLKNTTLPFQQAANLATVLNLKIQSD